MYLKGEFALNKVRIKFSKGNEIKYISHLDLLRTWSRILRRSGLPIKYSQGFNPHLQLSFAMPLSVGVTSESEYMDIEFDTEVAFKEVITKINENAPSGLVVQIAGEPLIAFSSISKAKYRVNISFVKECNFSDEFKKMMSLNEVIVAKKSKKGIKDINIIPDIYSYDINGEKDTYELNFELAAGSERNLNPELIMSAICKYIEGCEIDYYAIHRTALIANENLGLL